MVEKIKGLLSSIRFWQLTASSTSAYLAYVAANGYDVSSLLMAVSGWLAVVAGVGTVDKLGKR